MKIPLKAKICHRSLICWKTITKYVKCAKTDGGVRRESVERIPLGSQCEGEEEGGGERGGGGGEQVSTVDAERELRAKEEERFILIISAEISPDDQQCVRGRKQRAAEPCPDEG